MTSSRTGRRATARTGRSCASIGEGGWLWSKWRGTVLQMVLVPVLASMSLTVSTDILAHAFSAADWSLFGVPPAEDALISQLRGLATLWEYQLTLTIFVLTFFTQQAYAHYRSVYFCARAIQGRINDVCLLLAVGATRGEVEGATSTYSDDGAALWSCARFGRIMLLGATTPTTSDGGDGGLVDGDGPTDPSVPPRAGGPRAPEPAGLRSWWPPGSSPERADGPAQDGPAAVPYWCVFVVGGTARARARITRRSATLPVLKRDCCGADADPAEMLHWRLPGGPHAPRLRAARPGQYPLVIIATALYAARRAVHTAMRPPDLFFKGLLSHRSRSSTSSGTRASPASHQPDALVSELNSGAQPRWSPRARCRSATATAAAAARCWNRSPGPTTRLRG